MAQVTMDSKEYLEMITQIRELEQLKRDLIEGFTFDYNEDSYSGYTCSYKNVIPVDVRKAIVAKVVQTCVSNTELMQTLCVEQRVVFDLSTMTMVRDWGYNEEHYIGLLNYPEFKKAYQAACEAVEQKYEEEE